jgi:hypothetical protein
MPSARPAALSVFCCRVARRNLTPGRSQIREERRTSRMRRPRAKITLRQDARKKAGGKWPPASKSKVSDSNARFFNVTAFIICRR